jgi:hypothetical protein
VGTTLGDKRTTFFPTWQSGYRAFYKLISGPLYVGAGLATPSQIFIRYAPDGDNNNPVAYASDVEQSILALDLIGESAVTRAQFCYLYRTLYPIVKNTPKGP